MKICNLKIDVSCEASVKFQRISQNATPAMEFAPCHHFMQPWQCDSHKAMMVSKVLRLPRKIQRIFWKRCKSIAPATQNDFVTLWNMSECHKVPRLPRETKLRDVWNILKPSKVTPFAEIAIGTAIRPSHEWLRTVAPSSEHTLNPRPPEWNGNPCYMYSGKIHCHWIHQPEQLGHLGFISHHDHSLVGKLIQSIHMIYAVCHHFCWWNHLYNTFMVKYPHLLQKENSISMIESPLLQKLLDKITIQAK